MSALDVAAIAAPSPSNVIAFPRPTRARPPSPSDEAADILQCALWLVARGEIEPAANLACAAYGVLRDIADNGRA
jgi:hypothetical protein